MALYQLTRRAGDRHIAANIASVDPLAPAPVLTGMGINSEGMHALYKILGGDVEDSTLLEVVNPATGHFWHIDGISADGGTDDARP